ncbi:hypothetical protein [Aquimarina agarilytica]|uniref:hypothetical protein n=1 Tax=Aquimarina agarilytica TaxID=1087449 RepID=UPI0012F86646|nr:hypothetical protein [Aquimarina agarilytica]
MIKKITFLFYILFFIFNVVVVIDKGYVFTYDTASYLYIRPNVQPAYSIFLNIVKRIFGINYKEATIGIQLLMSYLTMLYFSEVLKKYFKFNSVVMILLFMLLTYPIYGSYGMCNKLVTKSLSTTFFLFFMASSVKWFFTKKNKHIFFMITFLVLLQLTRAQFLSISIALVLFVFYMWSLKELKKKMILVVLILSIPLISGLLEKTIYGVFHGHYTSRQLGNVSISTLPFYLSELQDYKLMPDEEVVQYFRCVHGSLEEKKLLLCQLPKNSSLKEKHQFYHDNYPKIMNQTIEYEAKSMYRGKEMSYAASYKNVDRIVGKTLIPLFMARPLAWSEMFYMNLAFPYYSIIPVIFLILLVSYLFFKKKSKILQFQGLIYFFSLLILGNLFLISISLHCIRRYFMYYDIVFALLALLLLCNFRPIKKYIMQV